MEQELEASLAELAVEVAERLPGAAVPDVDVPAAVLALGNVAGEFGIGNRVVLHFDGPPLVGRVERGALGHGPAAQRALPFETEVPVQPSRGVFLDDEDQLFRARGARLVRRFRGLLEVALLLVAPQSWQRGGALRARFAAGAASLSRVGHASGAARGAGAGGAATGCAVFALAGPCRMGVAAVLGALFQAALEQRHEVDHLAATGGARLGRP